MSKVPPLFVRSYCLYWCHRVVRIGSEAIGIVENMAPKCPCSWPCCAQYESALEENGPPQYRGSASRIRIKCTGKGANGIMRDAIHFCLSIPAEVQAKKAEYFIARHHFHPTLLAHLLDDSFQGLKGNLTTAVPSSLADDCGIHGKVFMFPLKKGSKGDKDPNQFLAVPNYGLADVKVMVSAADSARSGRVENMSSRRDLLEGSNNINVTSSLSLRDSSSCTSTASPSVSSIGPESSREAR